MIRHSSCLMPYLKIIKFAGCVAGFRLCVADVGRHFGADFADEPIELVWISFHHNADTAIGEVLDVPDDIKSGRNTLRRVTKADALNSAAKVDNASLFDTSVAQVERSRTIASSV